MPTPEKAATRSRAFVVSALLHCGIAGLLSLQPYNAPQPQPLERVGIQHYSVQLIRLEMPKYVPRTRPPERPTVLRSRRPTAAGANASAGEPGLSAAAASASARKFSMPAFTMPEPVRQTLLRPDVPPGIILQQEVPLPNMLPVFDEKVPVYPAKRFVAPALRQAQKAAPTLLAAAPTMTGLAAVSSQAGVTAPFADTPRLPVPAVPAAGAAQPAAAGATSRPTAQRSATSTTQLPAAEAPTFSVLSISENPALPSELLAIPPANQIAAGVGDRTGARRSGNDGRDNGQGTAPGRGATGGGHVEMGSAKGADPGLLAAAGDKGNGGGSGRSVLASGELDGNAALPGTRELTLPKDGKFAVVVLGSAAAALYPESSGTLSGKIVYTVYLRVGQRKNWILQYCLPKAAVSTSRVEGTRTPIEAPWPYNIVRPDHASDSDYVLVHGVVTIAGRFDQLAMVFPQDLEGKELLLQSLNRWTFRPAKRDGEAMAVEVLLIIPRED
jgi:hypothetical protein